MLYSPELNEVAAPRLFHSEYNFGGSYSLSFLVEDAGKARTIMSKLRIRPAFGTTLELAEPTSLDTQRLGGPTFHCLITAGANRKLMDLDVTAYRSLLD
jgi:hypothetical protein